MSPRIGLDWPTILRTAAEIADAQGLDAVTSASLARLLQVRPPSLYNHVESLDHLRKQLSIHGLGELYAALANAAIGRSGDDAVHAIAEAYVSFARAHPGLYEATHRAPDPRDPEVQRAGSKVTDLAIRVLDAYGLDAETTLHAVRGLRSMFHGFASLEQMKGFGLPLDLDVSFRLLINTYLAGLHTLNPHAKANA